jgi:diguanylate cyclase (GGDEF)-like protein
MQKRALQPFLLTLALCALPWIAASRPTGWLVANASFSGFVQPLPFLLLGVLAFLGVKLNQTRLFFVSLFLAASYVYLRGELPAFLLAASASSRAQVVGLAAPFSLGLIFFAPEGRLWSGKSLLSAVVALSPLLFFATGLRAGWPWLSGLMVWEAIGRGDFLRVPEATTLAAAAFAVASFLHRNSARRLLHVFIAVSLVPLWAALNFTLTETSPNLPIVTALAFACQSGLLVYAVFLLYWERVYLDELTGIPNRRALNEHLARLGKRYALAMVDIDHFKRFNDDYGHEEGDNVLRFVAAHLDSSTGGHAYRYGGEEFTVVLEEKTAEQAAETMESVRRTLADRSFTIRPSRGKRPSPKAKHKRGKSAKTGSQVRLTFSVGIGDCPAHGSTPEEVRLAADQALYGAKDSGRNCVALANPAGPRRRSAKQP